MPGEHDASLDKGEAYQEFFGATPLHIRPQGRAFHRSRQCFDPTAAIGEEQLAWLAADLKQHKPSDRIVVFTHRPLFDLYPQWDWATRDGAKAVEMLMPFQNVVVFYGHIHQENHHMTGHIAHHAAQSLIFPLPAPGSQPSACRSPGTPTRPIAARRARCDCGHTYTLTDSRSPRADPCSI